MIKKGLIFLIRAYQSAISPFLPQACRFYPTCSEYAIKTLQSKPLRVALFLAAWRILRCQPFSNGGYDPVK